MDSRRPPATSSSSKMPTSSIPRKSIPTSSILSCREKRTPSTAHVFLGRHRAFLFHHYMGNKFLTLVTNVLYNTILTDMETCFKAIRGEIVRSLKLREKRFGIEPEITAKLFKIGCRVYEVPITYQGRDFEEGKKISWKDGLGAVGSFQIPFHRLRAETKHLHGALPRPSRREHFGVGSCLAAHRRH